MPGIKKRGRKKQTNLGNQGNRMRGLGFQLCLALADLLHLEHPFHDELVLALLVSVALGLALPWQVELRLPAFVEWDQQMGTLVSVRDRHLRRHHLLLGRNHFLRRTRNLHCPRNGLMNTRIWDLIQISFLVSIWGMGVLLLVGFAACQSPHESRSHRSSRSLKGLAVAVSAARRSSTSRTPGLRETKMRLESERLGFTFVNEIRPRRDSVKC
ncbi:hypothetical protein STAS_29252 [Striga asiatica]|uniref:Uncharacterized protein n=1 Tax=Striga asiatica TaxID=4170 RepID=A0A5A7R3C7_STRAF|nr:hypothetical protein STAS_29252 [Striga asiatica]